MKSHGAKEVFIIPQAKEKDKVEFIEEVFRLNKLVSASGSDLLSWSSKFKKIEDAYRQNHRETLVAKKIAILSSVTTHHFVNIFRLFLYQYGIAPIFYEGEYDGIVMELMNPDSEVFSFKPDILLLLTYHTDIKDYPKLFSTEEEIKQWVTQKVQHYQSLWSLANEIKDCHVFQTLFVTPIYRQLGNLEANYQFSASNCLRLLNLELIRQKPPYVTFIDMDYLASVFGKYKWFSDANYYMSKQAFSFDAAGLVCYALTRLFVSHIGKIKKCLVLDLDNTLWGGVIGDDGLHGININPSNAVGEAYLAFQKYLKRLKERGVILAVCSKNEEDIAKLVFTEHSDMILHLDDIACFVANWDDKTTNLRNISELLNIGLDSIVFFDDNPAEREIVKQFLPDVEVIDVPEDPALYIRALETAACFEWVQLSHEDVVRSDSYVVDRKRSELQVSCIDYDAYLQSLKMKGRAGLVGLNETTRFTQLINKTNQFNLRTRRYSEATVEQIRNNMNKWAPIYLSLSDRFSNYGIMSSIVIQRIKNIAFIDTWVMSCRVLKRGLENVAFNKICDIAMKWGCDWVVGEYLPTKKNRMVSTLLIEIGFEKCPTDWFSPSEAEGTTYRFSLSEFQSRSHFIEIEELDWRVG